MGSEAVEDCVQGALASLYPPFESTAPPLLSQVFSVLESTYQQDSVRYLLDFFIPAKHLLQRLQQHACAQYVGCLFLHSGWPLCLGDRVVVQLSTLDWRLLRSTDFYLQVVPFSTRCPRLALKCLAPGGRNVQEVLVPEAQHPLVFTPEWLHSINKERGFQREGGRGLDTCLVSTCEGVVRLPWQEVVYPTFVSSPGDPSPSPSPPLEADSWSWDEDDGPSPGRERGAEPGGEYVELLESRDGPEGVAGGVVEGVASMGGAVSRQRYLEMHGICKTKTLPLCRRGRGLRLRRGRAWAHGKHDTLGGSRRGGATARRDSPPAAAPPHTTPHHFLSRPVPRVIDLERDRGSLAQERRPGVGREREGAGDPTPDQPANQKADHFLGHEGEGQSDEEELCHSDSPLDQSERLLLGGAGRGNADHPLAALARGSENADHPLAALAGGSENAERAVDRGNRAQMMAHETLSSQNDTELQTEGSATDGVSKPGMLTQSEHATDLSPAHSTELEHSGMLEDAASQNGKEVKTTGFRAHRRKRKGKGGRGKVRPAGRGHKAHGKAQQDHTPKPLLSAHSQSEQAQPQVEKEEPTQANEGTEEEESRQKVGENLKDQSQISPEALSQSGISLSDHCSKEALPGVSPDQSECSSCKTPPLLRELDPEVLQSGWLILTGTVDRMGRALVFTESHIPSEGYHDEELARVFSCYHAITRASAKDKGMTLVVDSRLAPPSTLCISTLSIFQDLVPGGLGCVLVVTAEQQDCAQISLAGVEVHTVCGTGVLQQFVDKQQLPTSMGGDFQHCHSAWLTYRLSLEQLTERCKSALSLLEEALQSLHTDALPRCTKAVSLSVDKHRQLMMGVLADQRLTELQRVGGAWLAGLTNGGAGLAQRSPDCRAALARTSDLYNSVDDALHRLVRESNQRGRGLDALSRLAKLEEKLDQCEGQVEKVLEQMEEFRDPPLSLSTLAFKQQKFKTFREEAMELHRETHSVLGEVENWAELDWEGQSWEGLAAVLDRLPSIRDKLRDMSHSLSDCWSQLHTTLRLLSTLTEASQWCDAVCVTPLPPASSSPLTSLPPIPPSRFHDARALALELGGGALLELWSQTLERYQQTLAQFKSRLLQAERAQAPPQAPPPAQAIPRPKAASSSSMCDLLTLQGAPDWEAETNLQAWGSLASLFRPQTCSTLKIGEEKKREGGTDAPLPPKPPRRRHPSFDLQALLGPRRAAPAPRPAEGPPGPSRGSPLSWLGRRTLGDTVLSTGVAAAMPGGAQPGGSHAGGGVLIRGVEVSSKEVVDHTGSPRQHVLLGRAERETGTERTTAVRLAQLCTRLLGSERQYVALLKAVEEHYLPLMDSVDTPSALRGQTDALFSNWSSLTSFHMQLLLPALEGAMAQTLLLQDCFNKYKAQFIQYSHYIRSTPEVDSQLVSQAADFFKEKLAGLATPSFPECLQAPFQQLASYCEALEELASLTPTSDSALSTLRQAQQQGEDLRASDLIIGCPVAVCRVGCSVGVRRKKTGLRRVFLYQQVLIFTKTKTLSPARTVYSYKHSVKTGEMGLTQSVGEDGLRFEVWVRQASRTRDCLTLQAQSSEEKAEWTHHIAQLLWTHAIHNTELCLKESLCMGVSSKLLLDVTGLQEESVCLTDRVHSSSDSSSVGSQKEGSSPTSGRHSQKTQSSPSPSTAV
ncbi:hypothetical protein AGOR_G00187550 [Albula goreensis]|uniref:DH domain-containing protein n=1 Tax=Albula goreensis TaxID=1534307 RepID=A0A8T3CYB0_9TELE|nr:hypothetical protein AGOR_G00187550 [Albula goreensis]